MRGKLLQIEFRKFRYLEAFRFSLFPSTLVLKVIYTAQKELRKTGKNKELIYRLFSILQSVFQRIFPLLYGINTLALKKTAKRKQ